MAERRTPPRSSPPFDAVDLGAPLGGSGEADVGKVIDESAKVERDREDWLGVTSPCEPRQAVASPRELQ